MPRAVQFDLVVVGTGTGLDVANWAVQSGMRVAIVEKGDAGGTCLNRGCIPSKMLIHSADVARTIQRAHLFGIRTGPIELDFARLVERVSHHVDSDSRRIRDALRRSQNPRYFEGEARFAGPKRMEVAGQVLEAPNFLLASGARPKIPPIPGLDTVPYLTSTEALRGEKLPASMVILGGGYIAAEMAHFYGSLGTRITIVQRPKMLLNHEDSEIARAYTEAAKARGFRVLTYHEATAVAAEGDGVRVTARNLHDGTSVEVRGDQLLVAVGLTPNSDTLDLPKAGVEVDARGYIRVDDHLETTAPGIFALGDAIGRYNLKHSANHEASYAFFNITEPHDKIRVDYHAMPHAVFGDPQVAGVGATEDGLQREGRAYLVGRHRYADTAMGKALEDEEGFVKILVDPETREILGCHILGHEAATLIHEVIVAMRSGDGVVENITRSTHIHPALPEVVDRAAGRLEPPS